MPPRATGYQELEIDTPAGTYSGPDAPPAAIPPIIGGITGCSAAARSGRRLSGAGLLLSACRRRQSTTLRLLPLLMLAALAAAGYCSLGTSSAPTSAWSVVTPGGRGQTCLSAFETQCGGSGGVCGVAVVDAYQAWDATHDSMPPRAYFPAGSAASGADASNKACGRCMRFALETDQSCARAVAVCAGSLADEAPPTAPRTHLAPGDGNGNTAGGGELDDAAVAAAAAAACIEAHYFAHLPAQPAALRGKSDPEAGDGP